jgi:uncharacterized protein YfbU (UPF0304 family)
MTNQIKLTSFERLALINTYEALIQSPLTNERDKWYYDKCIKILENGYEFLYFEVFNRVDNHTMPYHLGEFVTSVLQTYQFMQSVVRGLSDEQVQRLNEQISDLGIPVHNTQWKFPGFDGNAGDGCLSLTVFVIKMWDMEIEPVGNNFNSHGSHHTADYDELYEKRDTIREIVENFERSVE